MRGVREADGEMRVRYTQRRSPPVRMRDLLFWRPRRFRFPSPRIHTHWTGCLRRAITPPGERFRLRSIHAPRIRHRDIAHIQLGDGLGRIPPPLIIRRHTKGGGLNRPLDRRRFKRRSLRSSRVSSRLSQASPASLHAAPSPLFLASSGSYRADPFPNVRNHKRLPCPPSCEDFINGLRVKSIGVIPAGPYGLISPAPPRAAQIAARSNKRARGHNCRINGADKRFEGVGIV